MYNLILGTVLGLVLGSFVKCMADRSLTDKSFLGRSYCPNCKHLLRWYDLFPILSYLSTGGSCRYCHHPIGISYPLTEALMAALVGLLFFLQFPADLNPVALISLLINLVLIGLTLAILLTDIETGYIPDRLTYPAFAIILALLVSQSVASLWLNQPLSSDIILKAFQPLLVGNFAALVMGLFFGSIIFFTRGQGMGGGDLKLGIVMGLGLGFPGCLVALMIAFLSGSVVGVGMILIRQKTLGQTIPFGPFLSLGTIITIFWGQQILDWYLNLRIS